MSKNPEIVHHRNLILGAILLILVGISFYPGQLNAAAVKDDIFFFKPKNRIEISASQDTLTPHDVYGDWKNISVSYYRNEKPGLTWFARADTFSRREGKGQLGAAGVYTDWTDRFYTFTSLSSGTNVEYLPKFRADHDFNFKIGAKRQLVWTIGGTYIRYYNEHRDYIISTGLTTYIDKWVIGYRVFGNRSEPGSVHSHSHQASIGYGQDRKQMTTATYSFDKQAYLLTGFGDPENVNNYSRQISLNYRHWLGVDHGYYVDFSRTLMRDAYRAHGISLGIFREF